MKYLSLWDFHDVENSLALFQIELESTDSCEDQDLLRTQIARCYGLKDEFETAEDTLILVGDELDAKPFLVQGYYYIELGRILNSAKKPAEALPYFIKTLEISELAGEPLTALRIDALHMLAIVDPKHSQKWNLEAVGIAERSFDPTVTKWKASLYNNLGWSYFDEKDFEQAMDWFNLSLSERVILHQTKEINIARWCIARVHRELEQWDKALHLQEHNLRESPDDHFINEELALIYNHFGDAVAAKPHAEKALIMLEKDPWINTEEVERLITLRKISSEETEKVEQN